MDIKRVKLKENLIGDSAFYRRVITIVLPIIVQNTITNVVSLLDNVMVGRVGTLEMSAVAIVNQLLFVYYLCIFGGLSGAGIFATQFAGARDNVGVRHCFRIKLIIAVIMFALATGVFLGFSEKLIGLYLSSDTAPAVAATTVAHAKTYLKIMLVGLLPFGVTQTYSSSLRELGETRLPMLSSVAAILVNLLFNYLLIFGAFGFPKLGVAGAAVATVLSRFVELIIIIVATHLKKKDFSFISGAYKSVYIPKALCADVLKRGVPLLINEFLWAAGMAVLLQCYSVRGLQVVAAANIASTVSNLFNVVFISMGSAVAIMAGQYLGANEVARAQQTVWRLLALTVGACLIIGGIMAAFSPIIPHIYNTEISVKTMATQFLIVVAATMPIFAFAHDCYFTLRSGGKTGLTFIFDSAFTWGVCVPTAFILANYTSIPIVPLYLCVQLTELFKCIVGFILLKKGIWINNIIEKAGKENAN